MGKVIKITTLKLNKAVREEVRQCYTVMRTTSKEVILEL